MREASDLERLLAVSRTAPAHPGADAAERDLAAALREGPFHAALRAAVAARGLTLQSVRHRLARRGIQVGVTSLSYWRQGRRRPERPESMRAVQALEEILELPPHALTRLLGPRHPAAPATPVPAGGQAQCRGEHGQRECVGRPLFGTPAPAGRRGRSPRAAPGRGPPAGTARGGAFRQAPPLLLRADPPGRGGRETTTRIAS